MSAKTQAAVRREQSKNIDPVMNSISPEATIAGIMPPKALPIAPRRAEATPALSRPESIAATLEAVETMPTMSESININAS